MTEKEVLLIEAMILCRIGLSKPDPTNFWNNQLADAKRQLIRLEEPLTVETLNKRYPNVIVHDNGINKYTARFYIMSEGDYLTREGKLHHNCLNGWFETLEACETAIKKYLGQM